MKKRLEVDMGKIRPEGWEKPNLFCQLANVECIPKWTAYEAGADAILEGLKKEGLYGEYLKDYIISVKVRKDDPDWAEDFLKRIQQKGWLVFIPKEE